jgi:N-acetylglutamate synthase-like GNAT family acetyltransferase
MDENKTGTLATIRLYKPEDLESGRALWVELTEWHRFIYQSPGIGGLDPGHNFDQHLTRVGPEHIWIAEMDAQVVGLVGLIPGEGEAELEPLVVSEPYRGLGIGRQLTDTVIREARKKGFQQLKVRPVARNKQAISFFHEIGFDILGQVDLFMDFVSANRQLWKGEEQIAGRSFRI